MDLGVMVMTSLSRSPELELHYQALFSAIHRTPYFLEVGILLLCGGYSKRILSTVNRVNIYIYIYIYIEREREREKERQRKIERKKGEKMARAHFIPMLWSSSHLLVRELFILSFKALFNELTINHIVAIYTLFPLVTRVSAILYNWTDLFPFPIGICSRWLFK